MVLMDDHSLARGERLRSRDASSSILTSLLIRRRVVCDPGGLEQFDRLRGLK